MVRDHPICCPKCGRQVATEEGLMHYCFPSDSDGINCPNCGIIVVYPPAKVEW